MIDRLEVTPGPGTVIRYGNLAAWASAAASASLVSFLTESARNLAPSPVSGEQLADHLESVLRRRDPEPHVPFVVIGPSPDGWTALLHGPVQIWDGASWTAASPHPGWMRASLSPRPALSVSVSGAPVPPVSPDSMWDLEAGVVPGGGFILVPAVASATGRVAPPAVAAAGPHPMEATTVLEAPEGSPATQVLPFGGAAVAAAGAAGAADEGAGGEGTATEAGADEGPGAGDGGATAGTEGAVAEAGAGEGAGEQATGVTAEEEPAGATEEKPPRAATEEEPSTGGPPAAVVDLRSDAARARVVAYPPLPPAGDPPRPVAGAPVVAGVPCPRGHLNRPGMNACARCGQAIGGGPAYQVSATRPALGCLITDQGAVYRLDSGYLVGADPARDPTVRGRLARSLCLPGADVAASHAEIRLHDWDVVVTDRASEGGTHVFEPGAGSWERLRAYEPRVLQPGTHIAFGQRVATFVTPWARSQ